jgi:hypothetical protein
MSAMVELVKLAIKAAPKIFIRQNAEGCWEVCRYGNDSEPEIVILSAWICSDTARYEAQRARDDICARAAIKAMWEPTDAMIDSGRAATAAYLDLPLRGVDLERAKYRMRYQAMIDAALKE